MALIRKAQAGSDSFGHTWAKDGDVVKIDDPEQIAALIAIQDGGFSEVTPGGDEVPDPSSPEDGPETKQEISEINPEAPAAEPAAQDGDDPDGKPAAKKTAARKTTASKPVQE